MWKMTQGERLLIVHTDDKDEHIKCDYKTSIKANPSDYPKLLKTFYHEKTGKSLNLENPQTFNEKIQWMKLYDSTPIKTQLGDKYLAREWISKKIGKQYLVPLLGVWDRFCEIDFQKLPDKFVLKCSHGSGWNLIVTDKSKMDPEREKSKFDKWMKTNFAFCYGLELHYKNIKPKIIAEKYLENVAGIVDYRFYCFSGIPTQVWVDIYSGTSNHLRSIYDMDWNKLPVKCGWPDGGGLLDNKPVNFELMKEFAALLSEEFAFVRVDFFEIDQNLYVGEMTFTPMSGVGKFVPDSWDDELGKLLILPKWTSCF